MAAKETSSGSGVQNWTAGRLFIENWNATECRTARGGANFHQEINHKLPESESKGAPDKINTSGINRAIRGFPVAEAHQETRRRPQLSTWSSSVDPLLTARSMYPHLTPHHCRSPAASHRNLQEQHLHPSLPKPPRMNLQHKIWELLSRQDM